MIPQIPEKVIIALCHQDASRPTDHPVHESDSVSAASVDPVAARCRSAAGRARHQVLGLHGVLRNNGA